MAVGRNLYLFVPFSGYRHPQWSSAACEAGSRSIANLQSVNSEERAAQCSALSSLTVLLWDLHRVWGRVTQQGARQAETAESQRCTRRWWYRYETFCLSFFSQVVFMDLSFFHSCHASWWIFQDALKEPYKDLAFCAQPPPKTDALVDIQNRKTAWGCGHKPQSCVETSTVSCGLIASCSLDWLYNWKCTKCYQI